LAHSRTNVASPACPSWADVGSLPPLRVRTAEHRNASARPPKPLTKRSEAERNTIADAQKIVAIWNARQAGGRALWFYPTIGAVVAAGLPWLSFSYPACGQFGSVDLRTLDRHPGASISSLIPSASYRRCSPNAPYGGAAVAARRSGSSQMQIGCLHDST